jgi:hypothetical protein
MIFLRNISLTSTRQYRIYNDSTVPMGFAASEELFLGNSLR